MARRRLLSNVALSSAVAFLLTLSLVSPAIAQPAGPGSDIEFETLTTQVSDPTQVDVAPDGRVFIAERTGRIKVWHQDGTLVEAGRIGVDSRSGQCSDCPGLNLDEGGLHGLLLAMDFAQTGHLYAYYSVPNSLNVAPVPAKHPKARGPQDTEGKFRLSRFTVTGDELDLSSEVTLFENPAEWFHCCHYGGDLEWLADGTLLLSVGDDTVSSQSGGMGPRDYRVGQEFNNADLSSQNLADRRGKLLRIDVSDINGDGSMIPPDNPFVSNPDADPYVYAYGFRSNYRLAVDAPSQKAIVSTVGPDAYAPDPNRGPAAHEEIEVVPAGGGTNHGWPRCIADNIPYNDYDWATGTAGPPLSCEGMTPASLYYTYAPSPQTNAWFQMLGGLDTVIAGVSYRRPETGALRLPARLNNQFLFMDWSRGGMWSIPIDAQGNLDTRETSVGIVRLQGAYGGVPQGLISPIDASVGPDGAVYVAEYGRGLYNGGASQISRLKCSGCQPSSADYGGAPVLAPKGKVASVGVDPRGLQVPGITLAVAVAGVLALGWARRRRQIV